MNVAYRKHCLRQLLRICSGLFLSAFGVLAATAATVGGGSRFMVDVWTADQGLPNSEVTSLSQTPDGYLWIGTHKGGLVCFDGTTFTRPLLTTSPSLHAREVLQLHVDKSGTMWVEQKIPYRLLSYQDGTFNCHYCSLKTESFRLLGNVWIDSDHAWSATARGGLARFSRATSDHEAEIKLQTIPFTLRVPSGCVKAGEKMWLQSNNGALGYLNKDQFVPLGPDAGAPKAPVSAMACGPDDRLWVASPEGLAVWEGSKFRRITAEGMLSGEAIFEISFSGDGGVWVRTPTRMLKWLNDRWVVNVEPWAGATGLMDITVPIHGDADGGAWVKDPGQGLLYIDANGTLISIGLREGLPDTDVKAWIQDSEGGIWVGTRGGLVRLRPRLFEAVGMAQGLRQPVVRSIAEDGAGGIWLSSADGLTLWRDGRCEEWKLPRPNSGPPTTDAMFVKDPKADQPAFWVGTVGGGSFQWINGNVKNPFPPTKTGAAVRSILADSSNRIWFGGEFGLHRWDGSELRFLGRAENQNSSQIFDIREGANGDIWFGNAGAHLTRYRNGIFEDWTEGAVDDYLIYAVLPDADDTVWLGSWGGGLLRWHNGKFFPFTRAHGLPSDSVSQLLDDGLGFLWGGTRQGIFRVEKLALNRVADGLATVAPFSLFDREDGMPSNECTGGIQPSALRASDGRLWFSTLRGAVVVDPTVVKPTRMPPPARILTVLDNGEPLADSCLTGGEPTHLSPGTHTLEFRFTGLTLASAEKMRFRWRMSGVDENWVDGGFQRSVSYGGMDAGDYQFEVQVCNSDGVWNKTGGVFRFSIKPLIWQRTSFKIGAVLTLVLAAAGFTHAQQRKKFRRRVALLEARRAIEGERSRIARDLHDDLGAGLAQINISSGLVATEGIDSSFIQPLLQGIGTRSRELITALDEIVWAINPKNDSLPSLATYLCQYAKNFLNPAQISCRLAVDPDLPDLQLAADQRHGLFLAFAEALHNAVRHSGGSEVRIDIAYRAGSVHLAVVDNGCGIGDVALMPGADGLANMRERLTQLGGTCEVKHPPFGGTEIAFILPLP